MPVEVRLEVNDSPERVVCDEMGKSEEVGVPAAICVRIRFLDAPSRGCQRLLVLWYTVRSRLCFFARATSSSASLAVGVKGFSTTTARMLSALVQGTASLCPYHVSPPSKLLP